MVGILFSKVSPTFSPKMQKFKVSPVILSKPKSYCRKSFPRFSPFFLEKIGFPPRFLHQKSPAFSASRSPEASAGARGLPAALGAGLVGEASATLRAGGANRWKFRGGNPWGNPLEMEVLTRNIHRHIHRKILEVREF